MLTALILDGLVDQDDEVGGFAGLILGGLWDLHPQDRERRMGPGVRSDVQPADLRIQDIFRCRRKGVWRGGIALQELVAIDNLENTTSVGAITEVYPAAEPDRPMQPRRHWLPRRAQVLPHHHLN